MSDEINIPRRGSTDPVIQDARGIDWHMWQGNDSSSEAARQAINRFPLNGVPDAAAKAMASDCTLSMGLGSVGATAFQHLGRCGVGRVVGVDPDYYGPDSFLTQPIHWRDRCESKAVVQGQQVHQVNPTVSVRTGLGYAQDLSLRQLRQATIWIIAGHDLELPLWAAQRAAELGKTLLHAAIEPKTLTVLLRAYDLRSPASPCPACAASATELRGRRRIAGCDLKPNYGSQAKPTRAVPMLSAQAGILAATETIKWLTGMNEFALCNEELTQCALTHRSLRTELTRNPDCPLTHEHWQMHDIRAPASQTSLAMLAHEYCGGAKRPLIQVRSEMDWVSFTICSTCLRQRNIRRFAHPSTDLGSCSCGARLAIVPQGLHSRIPAADLRASWDRSLADLGLNHGEAVGMCWEDQWNYVFPHYELN